MTIRELVDLVLPTECAGCRRPGTPFCRRCARSLAALGLTGGPRPVAPSPAPPDLPQVITWGVYADPLRAAITAWKDEGRRDLAGLLAPLLARSLQVALARAGAGPGADRTGVLVVPAPSSRRSRRVRGDVPMDELAARAVRLVAGGPVRAGGARPARLAAVLTERRRVRDQSGLASVARRANVDGAFEVAGRLGAVVGGRAVVVVDDLMTTGATLAECARALRVAGAGPVVGATVAVAVRHQRPARTDPG